MSSKSLSLGAVLFAICGTVWFLWPDELTPSSPSGSASITPAKGMTVELAAPPVELPTIDGIVMPAAFYQKLPPSSRVPLTMPKGFKSGMLCPDGSYLPLLNGVPRAGRVNRAPEDGPLPPVVAKVTDWGGYEWYEHADGSFTTTRWEKMTLHGKPYEDVVTNHRAKMDENKFALSAPPDGSAPPAAQSPGSGGSIPR